MRDRLRELVAHIIAPLRRCQWCDRAALRSGELCELCLPLFVATHDDLYDACEGPDAYFMVLRGMGGGQ